MPRAEPITIRVPQASVRNQEEAVAQQQGNQQSGMTSNSQQPQQPQPQHIKTAFKVTVQQGAAPSQNFVIQKDVLTGEITALLPDGIEATAEVINSITATINNVQGSSQCNNPAAQAIAAADAQAAADAIAKAKAKAEAEATTASLSKQNVVSEQQQKPIKSQWAANGGNASHGAAQGQGAARASQLKDQQTGLLQPKDPWNILVDYNPQIGLGMRTKRHFFPIGEELVFLDGQFHTDESYSRRYHQHRFKEHYLIPTSNMSEKVKEKFSIYDPGKHKYREDSIEEDIEIESRIFIWHQYYEPRWDTGALAQSMQSSKRPSEIDIAKEAADELRRESALGNFAEGWTPSVQFPTDVFEEDEKVQIVEVMLEKIALKHHYENYKRFCQIFGQDVVQSNDWGKHFFTIDPEEGKGHPVTRTGGIIDTIKATDIDSLKPGQYGQKFFDNQVEITPNKIVISQMQQLMIHREQFEIKNTAKQANFTIYDIFASSPEILVMSEDGGPLEFPVRLKPGEALKVTVLMVPETLELIEAAIIVTFNPKYVFMLPVSIYVTNNMFGLRPLYYSNVNVKETIKTKIELYNPTDQSIILQEAYSTEDFVSLTWPNGKELSSSETYSKDYSRYLTIAPKETRVVLLAQFETNQIVDHNAMVHLMLDTGHIMRLPLYYHVYFDLIKFLPSIIDFGVVPLNFDAISIPVTLKIRNGHGNRMMNLNEVMLPLNDMRLDFVMGEWDRDPNHNTKVFNKNTKRLEEHRKGLIYADREFHLMTVIMKPFKFGMINTYIKMTVQTDLGATHKIELPIIGYVTPKHDMIIERKGNNFYQHVDAQYQRRNPFYGFLPAEPLTQLNVKHQIESTKINYKDFTKNQVKLKDVPMEVPMNVYGNFASVATGSLEVIHWTENITFDYFLPKYSIVNSMEMKQLGQFSLNLKDIQVSNGRKYFFIAASHSLFPQYIQISDQRLVCSIQEESKDEKKFVDCDQGINFDFGQIGLYQSKQKILNITNLGHETVILDWVNKTHTNDELAITYKTSYEEYKSLYPELSPKYFDESESKEIINRYNSTQRVGLFILPGHTITLTLSLEGVIASLKAGKASERMTHAAVFSFVPLAYRAFGVSYTYQVLPGGLSLLQNEVKFSPGFVGLEQIQEVKLKSDFQVPVEVISIHTTDARIMPVIKKTIVDPGEESAILDLLFDPSQSAASSSSQASTRPDYVDDKNRQNQSNKSSWKLSDLNIANFTHVISEALKTVNEDDVALWRSYQSKSLNSPTWIEGNWIQGVIEDIRAIVTVKTNIVGTIQIPVLAYVTKPRILIDRFVDFGGVQVGSYKSRSLELQNPFNETLYVNLFIGRNTVEANHEVERVNNYQRHQGQVELLEHAKGTKYERELMDDIQSRLNETRQQENYQRKLSQLPDIQKFCKNVRNKVAEQNAPSMQSWPDSNTPKIEGSPDKKEHVTSLPSGKPFEILLKNDNDFELCDLVHATMAMMPDRYFYTSSWQIINNYFSKRNLENQELEAINNYQKTKEQNHMKVDATDVNGVKEHLMYKLQEQLRSMYPDSLKIADNIDIEIAKDINKSSYLNPIMWDPIQNYEYLNYELAFPSVFSYGWPLFVRNLLSPSMLITPVTSVFSWGRDVLDTKSWSETGYKIAGSFFNGITGLVQASLQPRSHRVSTYVSSNYIDKQGRLKNVNPAPAITRQWELKSNKLHDEILFNNGTVGVQIYGQNFYINPSYQGVTYAIEPGQKLTLEDAIIFEPRTLTSSQDQMQMTLYIKSEKAVLQTLPLKGWASSAVLDITQYTKSVNFTNNAVDNSTTILASYSHNCMQRLMQLKGSDPEEFKMDGECLDALKSIELVQNQTLGKSTIPQVISLKVHDTDVLSLDVANLKKNFFSRLMSPFETLSSMQGDHFNKERQINQVFLWDLNVMNVGEIDFAIIGVYLEDPVTGERSCYQDGIRLWPCIDSRVNALKTKIFTLQYTTDFSVSEVRKTIVFESLDLIQRFPVQIDISVEALRVASEYVSDDMTLQRPIFGVTSQDFFQIMYSVMLGTALWLVYALFQIQNEESLSVNVNPQLFKGQHNKGTNKAPLDKVQNVLQSVTPAYVLNQYVRTQERFKSHSSIFLRECVNLSQRKNSITLDYQRSLVTRIGKQQQMTAAATANSTAQGGNTKTLGFSNVIDQQDHQQLPLAAKQQTTQLSIGKSSTTAANSKPVTIELPEESKQRLLSGGNLMTAGKRNNKASLYNSEIAIAVSNTVVASATVDDSDIDIPNSNNEEQQMQRMFATPRGLKNSNNTTTTGQQHKRISSTSTTSITKLVINNAPQNQPSSQYRSGQQNTKNTDSNTTTKGVIRDYHNQKKDSVSVDDEQEYVAIDKLKTQTIGSPAEVNMNSTKQNHDDSFTLVVGDKEANNEDHDDEDISQEDDHCQEELPVTGGSLDLGAGNMELLNEQRAEDTTSIITGQHQKEQSKILRIMMLQQPRDKSDKSNKPEVIDSGKTSGTQSTALPTSITQLPSNSNNLGINSQHRTSLSQDSEIQSVVASSIANAAVVAGTTAGGKKKPMSKMEQANLKKRKAKYDLILKQNKLKKEQEAVAAELARKEREKQRLLQLQREILEEEEEQQRLKQKQLKQQQKEAEAALQSINEKEKQAANRATKASKKQEIKESSEQTIQPADAEDEGDKDGYQENSIINQADRTTKPAPAPEPSIQATKNVKNKVQKGKSQQDLLVGLGGSVKMTKAQKRGQVGVGYKKFENLQQTPEGDSSFEQMQPQSITAQSKVTPLEAMSGDSSQQQTQHHRRGISWGISDRLTVTQESEQSADEKVDLDDSANYNSEREHLPSQSLYQQPPQHHHSIRQQQKNSRYISNSGSAIIEKSPKNLSTENQKQTTSLRGIAERPPYGQSSAQNKRQQFSQAVQKQYIAKQSNNNASSVSEYSHDTSYGNSNGNNRESYNNRGAGAPTPGGKYRSRADLHQQQIDEEYMAHQQHQHRDSEWFANPSRRGAVGADHHHQHYSSNNRRESIFTQQQNKQQRMDSSGYVDQSGDTDYEQHHQHHSNHASQYGGGSTSSVTKVRRGGAVPPEDHDYYSPLYQEQSQQQPTSQQQSRSMRSGANSANYNIRDAYHSSQQQQPPYGGRVSNRDKDVQHSQQQHQRRSNKQQPQQYQDDYMYYGGGSNSGRAHRSSHQHERYFHERDVNNIERGGPQEDDEEYYGEQDDEYDDQQELIDDVNLVARGGSKYLGQEQVIRQPAKQSRRQQQIDYDSRHQAQHSPSMSYDEKEDQQKSSQQSSQRYGGSGVKKGGREGGNPYFQTSGGPQLSSQNFYRKKSIQGAAQQQQQQPYAGAGGYSAAEADGFRRMASVENEDFSEDSQHHRRFHQQQQPGSRISGGYHQSHHYHQQQHSNYRGSRFIDSGNEQQTAIESSSGSKYSVASSRYQGRGGFSSQQSSQPRYAARQQLPTEQQQYIERTSKQSQAIIFEDSEVNDGGSANISNSSSAAGAGSSKWPTTSSRFSQRSTVKQNQSTASSQQQQPSKQQVFREINRPVIHHQQSESNGSSSALHQPQPQSVVVAAPRLQAQPQLQMRQQPEQHSTQSKPQPPQQIYLDSDEDEDDLIQSSAKHILKSPLRSSRHQSPEDDQDDYEDIYEAPKPQKNFFSIFKRIEPIFSRFEKTQTNEDQDSMTLGGGANHSSHQQSESLFSGSSNLNMFGGPKFDDYFQRPDEHRQQQSLFGGSSSFYDQSAGQQDLHSFRPAEQHHQLQQQEMQQQQPSSLAALRMSSRPLQQPTDECEPFNYRGGLGGGSLSSQQPGQQTLFSNEGFQWKKLGDYKPSKLPNFNLEKNGDQDKDH